MERVLREIRCHFLPVREHPEEPAAGELHQGHGRLDARLHQFRLRHNGLPLTFQYRSHRKIHKFAQVELAIVCYISKCVKSSASGLVAPAQEVSFCAHCGSVRFAIVKRFIKPYD